MSLKGTGTAIFGATLLVVACGSPTTSPQVSPVPTETTSASARTSELDAVLVDRSLLSLGLVDATSSGRFRIEPGFAVDFIQRVEGRYWVTDSGNVYTVLDIDPDLIADQMTLLVEKEVATGGHSEGSRYLASLREHYRGNEFQIGLADLVRWMGVGLLPLEVIEQLIWFGEVDGIGDDTVEPLPSEPYECRDAVVAFDAATRDWVGDLEIEFATGDDGAVTWIFPVQDLDEALADQIGAGAVCDQMIDGEENESELRIDLTAESDMRRIEVFIDPKIYPDREPELMLTILMWPDTPVEDPPESPSPAPLLTLRGTYLVAIGVCKELPWIYSNFMAGDNYSNPSSGGYAGPIFLSSDRLCEDEVPEERREDGSVG